MLAYVGGMDRYSWECRVGELELCRVGRLEYRDILHNGDSRRRGMMRPGVTREYREKKEREENKRDRNKE